MGETCAAAPGSRESSGSTRRRAAPVVAALVALAGAACGGDDQPTGAAATTPPAASATGTPTPTPTGPQTLPSGELEPGTYTTGTMRPPTTFRVGPGWQVLGELETGLALAPKSDTETPKAVSVTVVKWIITKPLITDGELASLRERFVRPAPKDLVGWLRSNPYLQLTTPKPVTLAGLRGVQFDVAVKNPPRGQSNCQQYAPKHCITLFAVTEGQGAEAVELEGVPSRYTLLDLEGQPILVTVSAEAGQLDGFFRGQASEILSSLKIG